MILALAAAAPASAAGGGSCELTLRNGPILPLIGGSSGTYDMPMTLACVGSTNAADPTTTAVATIDGASQGTFTGSCVSGSMQGTSGTVYSSATLVGSDAVRAWMAQLSRYHIVWVGVTGLLTWDAPMTGGGVVAVSACGTPLTIDGVTAVVI